MFFTGKWQGVCTGLCPQGKLLHSSHRFKPCIPSCGNTVRTPANKHIIACFNKSQPKCAESAEALTHFPDAISCFSFIRKGNFPFCYFSKMLVFKNPLSWCLFIFTPLLLKDGWWQHSNLWQGIFCCFDLQALLYLWYRCSKTAISNIMEELFHIVLNKQ